jgi:hypothetical protein
MMQWLENEELWRTFYLYMFGERKTAAAPGAVGRVLAR